MRPPMRNTGLRLSSVYSILMPPSLSDHPHGGQHHVTALVYLRHPRIGITSTQMLDSPQHRCNDAPPSAIPTVTAYRAAHRNAACF